VNAGITAGVLTLTMMHAGAAAAGQVPGQRPTPNSQLPTFFRSAGRDPGVGIELEVGSWKLGVEAAAQAAAGGVIAEVRVHGNHTTPDADILRLAGLATGGDASEAALRAAARALGDSGRFADVEIRRRFRSIDDPTDILVVIVVDEHAAVSADDLTPGIGKRMLSSGMWLPILSYADGYGFTYGAQFSFVGVAGKRSQLSVPMTWGGERKIGVQLERSFDRVVSVVRGGGSLSRRENPRFELPDRREEVRVDVERQWTDWLRIGATAKLANVNFGPLYEARHTAAGAHLRVDTRVDPSFPRNAVYITTGWERLTFSPGGSGPPASSAPSPGAGRWKADARGYVGLLGSTVAALRAQISHADAPLPHVEQALLGGSDSLRGYAAGHRAGDRMLAFSAELRLPLNSPVNAGRFGVKAFVDTGTTWLASERLRDQTFDRGLGTGVYFGIGPLMTDIAVAWPRDGSARGHFSLGITF
jgi:outer membrane protein assembly factor BamA